MTTYFYNGPKISIAEDYVRIKEKNIKLDYKEIKSISIQTTRLDKEWMLFIIGGLLISLFLLFVFCLIIQSLLNDSSVLSSRGPYERKSFSQLLVLIFIGVPVFIIIKIKKRQT